jgi:hypothetical protein
MNDADINMQGSIDRQIKQIAKKFKPEISQIDKVKNDSVEFIKTLLRLIHDNRLQWTWLKYNSVIPIYYILKREFTVAWIANHYITDYDDIRCNSEDHEDYDTSPLTWDLKLYWENAGQPFLWGKAARERDQQYLAAGKKVPCSISLIPFRLNNQEYNRNLI